MMLLGSGTSSLPPVNSDPLLGLPQRSQMCSKAHREGDRLGEAHAMWSIGLGKPGLVPDYTPFRRETFEAARWVLVNILHEAGRCALEAGAEAEAALLSSAQDRIVDLREQREVNLAIGGYEYWIARVQ